MLLVLRKGGVANEKVCIKGFQIWAKFRTLAQLSRANGGGGETRPQPLLLSCFQTPSGSLGRRLVQRYPGNSHPGPPPGALNTGALLPAQPTVLGIEPHKASDWTLFSRRYTRATAQIAEGGTASEGCSSPNTMTQFLSSPPPLPLIRKTVTQKSSPGPARSHVGHFRYQAGRLWINLHAKYCVERSVNE